MRNVRKKPNFLDTKVIPFLKKYGIFLIVLFLVFPYVYKYAKMAINIVKDTNLGAKQTENANENAKADPVITKAKVEAIKKAYPNVSAKRIEEIETSAKKIAYSLGTNVDDNHVLFGGIIDLYNIRAMVEDEAAVIKELKKYTGTFPIVEEMYYKTATKSKNLKNDLIRLLSASDIKELSNFYKKAGYSWL
ncbi:hypothetical protein IR010_00690 [Flavobacterium sp. MR2016-29]|uniref:hypothetical protein n=1 Tax=Flavobacterium sp. MR2016-29 TaxID=2783795 RepID=UPI00188BE827|nr:hypothetical protein [Flavobacterium sp. MR2016-29]MBF4491039.1 hypothetical protein [Flavobacterium sp. MR2016-29]